MSDEAPLIRPYKDGDEIQIAALFQRVFGRTRSPAEWRWRYVENPAGPGASTQITVVEKSGQIIGHYAYSPVRMSYGSHIVTSALGTDTMMDKAHTQMGLLRKAIRAQVRNIHPHIPFAFGFPTPAHEKIGARYGYKDVGRMLPLFRRLSVRASLRRRAPWVPAALLKAATRLSHAWYRPRPSEARGELRHAEAFTDPRVNVLWDAFRQRYGITAVRDLTYLQWRYRRGGFTIILQERASELRGYAVVKVIDTPDAASGYVLDLVSLDDPHPLVSESLRCLMAAGADHALCALLEGDPMIESLKAQGFAEHVGFNRFPVMLLPIQADVDIPYLTNPKNWHLTYSDSDAF